MDTDSTPPDARQAIAFEPIGMVRSPLHTLEQVPKGLGAKHDTEGALMLRPELEAGLTDIEGFSHLYVIWVFDRIEGYALMSRARADGKPHGVFATRMPARPNPIGLTVVELLGREGATLRVRGVDMLDGSPILDIKPYQSSIPMDQLRRGWLSDAEAATAQSKRGGP
jgi:tRNA-Thr(GGU) m(6)t(6)A37 methyltransferase TsaA